MPALLNLHQTQLGPITEPVLDIVNAVRDANGQIPRTFPTAIFMYGFASGFIGLILLAALSHGFQRIKDVKFVKFGPSFPDLRGGDKFFLEQENGIIYEGVVRFDKSSYCDITIDEVMEQKSVIISSSKLEQAEIEDVQRKAKRELRKAEDDHEYKAFMGSISVHGFASFVDAIDANVDNVDIEDDEDEDDEDDEEKEEDREDEDTTR
ncbi:uncharacterized protein EAF02_010758 [Botrytis sinoallii]|uniref:uncharacterized protein n=1 Tax=Botrytis sinoallii TaxID=1463999 RepID=UPI0019016E7A|nr:uncharacterized protein EAF02_010758 [Botrytis sinoallii]KAF7860524.1 hypothetical protein EAF02_010758 [Botrytis sinoallii]